MFGGGFGNTTPTFGGGTFGSPTPVNIFGQPTPPPQPTTSVFGGSPAFGTGTQQVPSLFGSATTGSGTTGVFGSQANTSSVFGQQAAPTTGLFGSTTPFVNQTQQQAGTPIRYVATAGTDTIVKGTTSTSINIRLNIITCMKQYENKSVEELRFEDYQLNRKGPQSSVFGSPIQQQTHPTLYSTATPATSLFGQPTTSAGGLFGSLSQPKPALSWGASTSTAPAFGTGTTGFTFGTAATSQAQPSLFGSSNTATSTTPAFGTTTPAFSFTQLQQQQGSGLFGQQKPATPAFGSSFGTTGATTAKPLFGGTTTPSLFGTTSTTSTPTFGTTTPTFGASNTTTPAFGTGSLFGNGQQQAKPLFGQQGTTQPANQSIFGGGTGLGLTYPTSIVTQQPTSFAGQNTAVSPFGGGTTGGATPQLGFPLGGNVSQQQQAGAPFGSGFLPTTASTGPSGAVNPLQQQLQMAQLQQTMAPLVPFGLTPYKDNQLFYNLISNRKVEDLSKPTDPFEQRKYRPDISRRQSIPNPLSYSKYKVISEAVMKHLTFPTPGKRNSINKFNVFDAFEEEERACGVNVLAPKHNVKRLMLSTTDLLSSFVLSPGRSVKPGQKASDLYPLIKFKKTEEGPLTPRQRNNFTVKSVSFANDSFLTEDDKNRTVQDLDISSILDNSSQEGPSRGDGDSFKNNGVGPAGDSAQIGCEAVKKTEPGAACGITCTRPGYYTKPSMKELDEFLEKSGHCIINGFEVGRNNYGKITFFGNVNVASVNIDENVLFRHKEVIVYPDDSKKPQLGEGLNCPAEIELERVWPIDKTSNDLIRSPTKIKKLDYEGKLRRACVRLEADFVSYNDDLGIWKFKVDHFSKYSCELEEKEGDVLSSH